eukprot:11924923-Heterocapsa_arctica.AAC.1
MSKCQCGQDVDGKRKGKVKDDPPAKNARKEKKPPVCMKRPAGAVFESVRAPLSPHYERLENV